MKVGMISLGCPKNRVASEQMLQKLTDAGYELTNDETEAEAIVINTCAFIEDAKQEAINTILETAQLKETGSLKRLIVAGCLSELYRGEILSEMPEVDAVIGAGSYDDVVTALEGAVRGEKPVIIGDNCAAVSETGRIISTGGVWTYLLIADGCDNFCSYCLIPKIRGRFRSRPMERVLAEARQLAERGYKELILVAQDLTHYGFDLYGRPSLAALLRELCKIDGLRWIRLHYLYPRELDDELIEVIASEPKIVKYIDIPIQHIDDRILKRMNRRDTGESIRALFKKLRERIPGLVLRTSLITGLPGEGEAELEELCVFLRETKIERAGVFPFSPEEGTRAARMDHVDMEEARRRAELVVDVQSDIIDAYNESVLGTEREVLCEGFDSQAQMHFGRSYAESPDIDGRIWFDANREVEPGTFVTVRLTGVMDGELTGELAEE